MGTNGPTGGKGTEPGKGLVDIPKLSVQRKEEIRSGILTGIRSWTKEPEEEPKRTKTGGRRRRAWTVGGIGSGCAAIALAVVLVQTGALTHFGTPTSGSDPATGVTGEPGPSMTNVSPGDDPSRYAEALSIAGIDPNDIPEGLAEPLLPLTYEEFRSRWEANANSEQVVIEAADKNGQAWQNALPRLDETQQNFGETPSGYGYTAWSNTEDGRLRELVFRLGPSPGAGTENAADPSVIRYVTTVLEPTLSDTKRSELLDRLRFRDFEAKDGSRIADSGGLLYTLDRNGENQLLIVQFMRAENQPDELGKWQDSLLDLIRK